jgi:hypothetical protein
MMKTEGVFGLFLLLGLCGCSPSIYSFKAEPNRICGGDPVKLSWNASKAGMITGAQAPGEVESQGSAQVFPRSSSVRYHFEVSGLFGSAARDVDVEIADRKTGPIGQSISDPSATCSGSTLAVTAVAPPELVSSNLLVGSITTLAEDKHAYHVEHAGKTADLAPGASTDAFAGLPLTGDWKLSLTLLPAEQCGTPSVPRNLGVQVFTSCAGGG